MPLPLANLTTIIQAVRQLVRSPSTAQITDNEIIFYVNTFVEYDFPQNIRLFPLKKTLTFYLNPYQDTYFTNTTNPNDPLFNFQQIYTSVSPPVYVVVKEPNIANQEANSMDGGH